MSYITLILFEFKQHFKQPFNLALFVLVPLVLATILGSAFREYESDVFIRTCIAPISATKLLMTKIIGNQFRW